MNTPEKLLTDCNAQVRLLTDIPVDKDEFGAHDLLAESISQLVEKESGGKAVAIEGGWGAGKSTIIELLRAKLDTKEMSSTKVFVFDAWSHEGDPLRRVFLESLTDFCSEFLSNSQKEEWNTRRKTEITGKSRESFQRSTPVLRSSWTLLGLAVLATFPIAVALLNGLSRQPLHGWVLGGLITSLVISLVVPLSLFGLWVYCKLPLKKLEAERREQAGAWISLYAKKIDETTNTTAHETQGPTSLEFQRYFSSLMADYFVSAKNKLVIVLDNLDRVPAETARTLWTTLRVFAECCEQKENREWSGKVWFIVPYDPAAAKRLWDDGLSTADDRSGESTSQSKDPVQPKLSAAFLDKIFQIRFDVPPLLLTDWKDYLERYLVTALGSLAQSKESIHRIFLLSRKLSQLKHRPPTPRHLKLFINDIGALARRFGDSFPVEHLALYAMLRRQGHDVRHWLLHAVEDHPVYKEIMGGSEFIPSLCAISYGIRNVEKARDLHLRGPIQDALASGSGEELKSLMKAPGFWPVMEIVCEQNPNEFGKDESAVIPAIAAISESKLLLESRPELHSLKRFVEKLIKEANWTKLNAKNGKSFCDILQLPIGDSAKRELVCKLTADKSELVPGFKG